MSIYYSVGSIVFGVLWVISVLLFFLRRKMEPIKSRGWEFVLIYITLNCFFFVYLSAILDAFRNHPVNCNGFVWVACFFIPVWSGSYGFRCYWLFFVYRFNQEKASRGKETNWYISRRRYLNLRFQILFYCLFVILGALMHILFQIFMPLPIPFDTLENCLISIEIPLTINGGIAVAVILPMVLKLFRIHDSFHIKTELIVLTFTVPPLLMTWLVLEYLHIVIEYKYILLLVAMAIVHIMLIIYPLVLSYQNRKQIRRLTTGTNMMISGLDKNELFLIIIENELLFMAFQKYCVQSFCVENLLFYRDVLQYEKMADANERSEWSKKMRDMYFLPQSPLLINIIGETKQKILEQIEAGQTPENLFIRS